MKIDTGRLESILKYAGLIKTSKPYIDPIKLMFTDEGLWIKQSDDASTLAVVAFFPKDYFIEYDFTGEVIIPVKTTYKLLRKVLRDSTEVALEFTENKFSIIGKTAKITDSLMTVEVRDLKDIEIKSYKNLYYSPSFGEIVGYLRVDYANLSEMECDSDIVFEWSDKGLKAKCTYATTEIEKNIPAMVEEYKQDIRVKIDSDLLDYVLKATKTTLNTALIKAESGPGPVIFGVETDAFRVSYWIAPKIE